MTPNLNRRAVLALGSSALGVSLLGLKPAFALGADGSLVIRSDADIAVLDPANRLIAFEDTIIQACSQSLARFKPNSTEWEPDAAKSVQWVSDTEITFELNPGQMFHGGYGEMTAEDVKFSFERFLPDAAGNKPVFADDWAALDHVEVTGTYTGRILLKNPAPAVWTLAISDVSGAILSKKAVTELGDAIKTRLIGTGPYMLTEWLPNDRIVLAANPDYAGSDKPAFPVITVKPIQEAQTALLAFQAGELDFTAVDAAAKDQVAAVEGAKLLEQEGIGFTWIGMNAAKAPLDDLRVRQAIRLGIDMDAIIAGAYAGNTGRANALLAPTLLGYWADAPVYQRDVAAAQALLAEAGQTSIALSLTCLNDATSLAVAQIVQALLSEIGVTLTINALDAGSYWGLSGTDAVKGLDLSLIPFSAKLDPSFNTQWFTAAMIGIWNWQNWSSPEFDTLHTEAASITDEAARAAKYIRMQQILDESATCVWVTHGRALFAHSAAITPALQTASVWQLRYFAPAKA